MTGGEDIVSMIQAAVQHHQSGRLGEAEVLYRQVLQVQPDNLHVMHFLGVLVHQSGRHDDAVQLISSALELFPGYADAHNNLGLVLQEQGRVQEAVMHYRQALALKPEHAEAHNNLGVLLQRLGQLEEAIGHFRQALTLRPKYAEAHNNLGLALRAQGKLDEAIGCYRKALALRPGDMKAYNNLGVALQEQGKLEEAVAHYRQALQIKPEYVEAHNNIGLVLQAMGRHGEAEEAYGLALKLRPEYAEAHNNLGALMQEQGRMEEAAGQFREALEIRPGYVEAHNNLGVVLREQKCADEAISEFRQALALRPDYAEAHNNLGLALHEQDRYEEAFGHYQQALALKPDYLDAHINLGNAFQETGNLDQAVACYERVLALQPNHAVTCNNLGNVLRGSGRPVQALTYFQRALETCPDYAEAHSNLATALLGCVGKLTEALLHNRESVRLRPDAATMHSNLLLALNYAADLSPEAVFAEHQEYARRHVAPLAARIAPHLNDRTPARRLKLGYVSADFRNHSVAQFIEPVLSCHDHAAYEVYCYYNGVAPDAVTTRLQGHADHWRAIAGQTDEQVAERIRADGIDILIDLSGHTGDNRLLVFARKPAPVQVTWLGYPNTTGLSTMDYRITDGYADPEGMTEHLHTERLMRLPESFSCFQAPEACPEVGDLPLLGMGHVTFGSFNNYAKISAEAMAVWARILQAVPGSKLKLLLSSLEDDALRQAAHAEFSTLGIEPDRVELLGVVASHAAHLERYNGIDIGLDPFPYNGTTTNCDALWMGVPVVTLAGKSHVGRVGVSQLSNLGLSELVARNEEEYVEIAAGLAGDVARLRGLRSGLRERMLGSALMDAERFTRNLESAYREMWHVWCGGEE